MITMNMRQVANAILTRRNLSPTLMIGEMVNLVGSDGYAESLRRRWVEPDYETSLIQITNNVSRLSEMREIITEEEPQVGDSVMVAAEGQRYSAVVQKMNPDGSMSLSFGDQKPAGIKPSYQKNEVQLVKPEVPNEPSQAPATGSPTGFTRMNFSGPRAPGIG